MSFFSCRSKQPTTTSQARPLDSTAQNLDLEFDIPSSTFDTFTAQLREGYYTGILESYGVAWDMEKVARDTLQNFYDPELSIDNVSISLQKTGLPLVGTHCIRIEASPEYDYRKLLHIGGTGKANVTDTAGGFGEGAKVLALVLLRDFKFSQVRFGCGDWQIDFYLATPPEGSYDEKVKGLFAKLTDVPYQKGNYIEFHCGSQKDAHAFLKAKDYFFHSENADFHNPTIEVSAPDGGRFGFRYLGTRRGHSGHVYDAGQRRHYKTPGTWEGVEGLTVWTIGKQVFDLDRDRGAVSDKEINSKLILPMVKTMSFEQLQETILAMESGWPFAALYSRGEAGFLLDKAVNAFADKGGEIRV